MDVVVAADQITHAAAGQAIDECLLRRRISPRVRPQEHIRVVLADEVLVGEDEGVAVHRVPRQGAVDPALLVAYRIVVTS